MKALWIRVEAHELRSPRMKEFADALGVSRATALGHFVALGGAIAEYLEDGNVTDISDSVLADWAGWVGKGDKFGAAVREVLVGSDGVYADWAESMGKLVQRRAIDRQRKTPKAPDSVEIPRKFRGNSLETDSTFRGNSVVTGRNGTVRKEPESTRGFEREEKRSVVNTPARDFAGADLAAPLRSLSLEALLLDLEPRVRAFLEHFYRPHPRADLARVRDVAIQLLALQRGDTVPDHRKQLVRAYSLDRLATKCRELQHAPAPRDPNAAMTILLIKLGDTSDLAGSGTLPGQLEAKALAETGPLDDRVAGLIDDVAAQRTLPPKPSKTP